MKGSMNTEEFLKFIENKQQTEDCIYSNFDHCFDSTMVEQVEKGAYAQHAAYNFCGYVWKDNEGWHEAQMVYGSVVRILHAATAEAVIKEANECGGTD